jgi:hypothetical protein
MGAVSTRRHIKFPDPAYPIQGDFRLPGVSSSSKSRDAFLGSLLAAGLAITATWPRAFPSWAGSPSQPSGRTVDVAGSLVGGVEPTPQIHDQPEFESSQPPDEPAHNRLGGRSADPPICADMGGSSCVQAMTARFDPALTSSPRTYDCIVGTATRCRYLTTMFRRECRRSGGSGSLVRVRRKRHTAAS